MANAREWITVNTDENLNECTEMMRLGDVVLVRCARTIMSGVMEANSITRVDYIDLAADIQALLDA